MYKGDKVKAAEINVDNVKDSKVVLLKQMPIKSKSIMSEMINWSTLMNFSNANPTF